MPNTLTVCIHPRPFPLQRAAGLSPPCGGLSACIHPLARQPLAVLEHLLQRISHGSSIHSSLHAAVDAVMARRVRPVLPSWQPDRSAVYRLEYTVVRMQCHSPIRPRQLATNRNRPREAAQGEPMCVRPYDREVMPHL